MIGSLLILGFTLSLDNFRTAIVLGGLRPTWRRSVKIAVTFGIWDGVAPLVGIVVGHYVGGVIGSTADIVGAIALGVYGLYLIVQAWRTEVPDELNERVMLFGLPVPLSVDNVVAGTSLGLLGYSPWLAPPLFATTTALMSLAGLQIGRVAAHLIPVRPDLLTGAALIVMAVLLGFGVL
ncbi:MAG: manganese efflux pump [Solirubrobacterales bacterium]|nr:manganese efflux pump [Solirubrobacterales bacterium]